MQRRAGRLVWLAKAAARGLLHPGPSVATLRRMAAAVLAGEVDDIGTLVPRFFPEAAGYVAWEARYGWPRPNGPQSAAPGDGTAPGAEAEGDAAVGIESTAGAATPADAAPGAAVEGDATVTLFMPVGADDGRAFEASWASLRRQTHPRWTLRVVPGPTGIPEAVAGAVRSDRRVRIDGGGPDAGEGIPHPQGGTDSGAAPSMAGVLEPGAMLAPQALARLMLAVGPGAVRAAYSDDDAFDAEGKPTAPRFKPAWNPELLLASGYVGNAAVYPAELVERGRGDLEVVGAGNMPARVQARLWAFAAALRALEQLRPSEVRHVPEPLYRAPAGSRLVGDSVGDCGGDCAGDAGGDAGGDAEPGGEAGSPFHADTAVRRALVARLLGERETVTPGDVPGSLRIAMTRPEDAPLVTIVVPTRNQARLLRQCVAAVARADYPRVEIVIVDNGSDDPVAVRALRELAAEGARVVAVPGRFNYSALCNAGAAAASGEVFVFLNDDVEADAPGWLDELVSLAVRRDTGAVGARLWYPDGRLQHGGIILGVGGAAGHAHKYLPRGRPGYMGRAALPQQLSAVTGACLAVRRAVFEKVDGMDESFPVAFNDVDLCLRIRALGYRNVWTPYAQLTHHESASRGSDLHGDARRRYEADRARLMARWGEALRTDPAYNPNLTLDREDFTLAWPPRGRQPR